MLVYARACVSACVRYESGENNYVDEQPKQKGGIPGSRCKAVFRPTPDLKV